MYYIVLLTIFASQVIQTAPAINSIADIEQLFPTTTADIKRLEQQAYAELEQVDAITKLPQEQQTFASTFQCVDDINNECSILASRIKTIEYLHPDQEMRQVAHDANLAIQRAAIETLTVNKKLYLTLEQYVLGNMQREQLTQEQQYFVEETLNNCKRGGLHLDDAILEQVKLLKQEIATLESEFVKNISDDTRSIEVTLDELNGLSQTTIKGFEKTERGTFLLRTDYPTVDAVMKECMVEATRKKMYQLLKNKAYPINEHVLHNLMIKRNTLAQLIGFPDYTTLDLSSKMAKTAANVEQFVAGILPHAQAKQRKEIQLFLQEYPNKEAMIDENGIIQPWNMAFIQQYYLHYSLNFDDKKVAEYFSMDRTIDALLHIYEQFLDITFKKVAPINLWHPDVRLVEVYKNKQLAGYIMLDLHPRPKKFYHACHATIIPAVKKGGIRQPSVGVLITNFPKPSADHPSLLKIHDVRTFFHEFGHALHAVLGVTELASFSGTRVKMDFVEMPSQMLENWLKDASILKQISKHYNTGEPLPDETIATLAELERVGSGTFITRQLFLTLLSLRYFNADDTKQFQPMMHALQQATMPQIACNGQDYGYCGFGHLAPYAACYYGYMWSEVYATHLFEKIKQGGLLNPAMGNEYIEKILSAGGSKDPYEMLTAFLGETPNQQAFMKVKGFASA